MNWRRRKNDDGRTEYVSGKYELLPCYGEFTSRGLPRVRGWDIKYDGKELRYTGEERTQWESAFAYTVRKLSDAKLVAEKHAALKEAIARPAVS